MSKPTEENVREAEQILEEMRGGPLLACHPDRSRDIIAHHLAALTAENAKLRERERVAYESRNAAQERCNTAEREVDALRLDLARVTADAAKECGRLRAELVDAGLLHLADEQSVRNMEKRLARVLAPATVYLVMDSQTSPDSRWARACAVDACSAIAAALAADGPEVTK